ncbi:MAG: hypothetical protein AAB582_03335 [Patescibacteria group bacterium]
MTLRKAYELAGVTEPLALHHAYCELEQPLFKERTWDYDNPDQLHNRIKLEIEEENLDSLSEEERVWCREILWFWHHHAISCAVWKQNLEAGRFHAESALAYQEADHPNKITRLLFLLLNGSLGEAKQCADNIQDEVEGPTAQALVEWYENGEFFGSPR